MGLVRGLARDVVDADGHGSLGFFVGFVVERGVKHQSFDVVEGRVVDLRLPGESIRLPPTLVN